MRCLYALLLLLLPATIDAQALNGEWKGRYRFILLGNPALTANLFFHSDSLVSGTTHLRYSGGHYEHYTVSGTYRPADSTVIFTEDSTLGLNLGLATNCRGRYTLKLQRTDTTLRLEGRWKDRDGGLFSCPSSGVWLEKPIPRKPAPAVNKRPARPVAVQQLVEIPAAEADSVVIEVRDAGQVDGDVVSLWADDSLLASRLRLAAEPKQFQLSLSPGRPVCNVHLVAESMGSTPPCTAQLVVRTRSRQWEATLESSFSGTAVIELFRKD